MEGNSPVEIARRNVLCQVFSDLSQFIVPVNPNTKVNILIRNINKELSGYDPVNNPLPAATVGVGGLATDYYIVPSSAPNFKGIIDGQIWKTINSGVDAYSGIASPIHELNQTGATYYHGMVAVNFWNPLINWHTDLSQNTSTGLIDLYTVLLHEVTHALDFASLINSSGDSQFGPPNHYYARYDLFLKTTANVPLITNTGACSLYEYGFNSSLSSSVLAPSTSNCPDHIQFGGSVNQSVYTPPVYANESSLSHLEDVCHVPTSYPDDTYYVMSNNGIPGSVGMKRYLKPEERSVLCDLGYQVNTTYGNASNLNYYNYGGSTCLGLQIAGVNDGITSGGFYQYVVNENDPITISDILNNDYNAVSFECLEDIYGNGTLSNTSGTSFTYNTTASGIGLLRYIPVSASGNRGNITYVIVYISEDNCTPEACTMLNNSGFENTNGCGAIGSSTPAVATACWIPCTNTPDLFQRNCTNAANGLEVLYSVPAVFHSNPPYTESWSNAPNDHFIGMASTSTSFKESVQSLLNTPLIPNHSYTISFRARLSDRYYNIPMLPGTTGQITFGAAPTFLGTVLGPFATLPSSVTPLGNPITIIGDHNWNLYSQTFTYNGTGNLSTFVLMNTSVVSAGTQGRYVFVDDITLIEVNPALVLTLPDTICPSGIITDLSIFAPVPNGTFAGNGVQNSGGIFSFDASVAGAGTHIITYTHVNSNGCSVIISDTVTVANFTVSVSPAASTICNGSSVNLTASGADTYIWSPATGLSATTGATVTATPASTVTYTVTGTQTGTGCYATATAIITVNPCTDCQTGTLLSGTVSSSPTANTTLRVANNITITGNVTFTGNNVKIYPGVTITVASTATLNITGAHLYGCQDMWQGIVVQPGGKVSLQPYISGSTTKTPLIEDAIVAIDFLPLTVQQSSMLLQVDMATFNRNLTSIHVQGYPFANVGSMFEVKNSLFTCRKIYNPTTPNSWAPTMNVKAVNGNPNPYENPYIAPSFGLLNLKAPHDNTFSAIGIQFDNTGITTGSSPVYHTVTIGNTFTDFYNVFDNLKVAVHCTNSNVKLINTTVQFPQLITTTMFNAQTNPNIGTGVYAVADSGSLYKIDIAGETYLPNKFYNLSRALQTLLYNDVQFHNNALYSKRTNDYMQYGYMNGYMGMYAYAKQFDKIYATYNKVYNIDKGVNVLVDAQVLTSPGIAVSNNLFQKKLGTNAGSFTSDAVYIANTLTANVFGGMIMVMNNAITGSLRGITLNNWTKANIWVKRNEMNLGINPNAFFGASSYGIAMNNCLAGSTNQIHENNVIGFSQGHQNYKGIALTQSVGNELKCNGTRNTHSGLYFSGYCGQTTTYKTTLESHRYGLVLDNNGIIGQQGTASVPADNRWVGTWSATGTPNGNFKNACLNGSLTDFSKMYVRNSSSFTPIGSVFNLTSNDWGYSNVVNPITLFYVSSPPSYTICPIIVPPGGGGGSSSFAPGNEISETTETLEAEEIVSNASLQEALVEASEFVEEITNPAQQAVMDNQVYRLLDLETAQNNAQQSAFSQQTTPISTLWEVEKALAVNDLGSANSNNNAILTTSVLENSYQQYYQAYLNYKNGTFSETDSLMLTELAQGCPATMGASVFQAATLYNVVYQVAEVFETACAAPQSREMHGNEQATEKEAPRENNLYQIYPIPNKGTFTVQGELMTNDNILLLNTEGKIVYKQAIREDIREINLNTTLQSGVYFVMIKDHDERIKYRSKIVVIK